MSFFPNDAPTPLPPGFDAAWDARVAAHDVVGLATLLDSLGADATPGGSPAALDRLSVRRLTMALRIVVDAPAEHAATARAMIPRLMGAGANAFDTTHPITFKVDASAFERALSQDHDDRARTIIESRGDSPWGAPVWGLETLAQHPHRPDPAHGTLFETALDHQWDNPVRSGPSMLRLWNAVLLRRPAIGESPDQLGALQIGLLNALHRHRVRPDMDQHPKLLQTVIDLPAVRGESKHHRRARQTWLMSTLLNDLRWGIEPHQATALLQRALRQRAPLDLARCLIQHGAKPDGLDGTLADLEAEELRRALRVRTPGEAPVPRAVTAPRRRL